MNKVIIGVLIILSVVLVACGPTSSVQAVDANATPVLLAGTTTPLYEFSQTAYEQALADNKKIYLMWYATWCPSCKAEQKIAQPYFDTLDREDVIGFRVNFKDKNTDANEKALTQEFQVTSQTTKIFIVDGERVHKTPQHYVDAAEYEKNFNIYFGEK